jgi:hypothetical protein
MLILQITGAAIQLLLLSSLKRAGHEVRSASPGPLFSDRPGE